MEVTLDLGGSASMVKAYVVVDSVSGRVFRFRDDLRADFISWDETERERFARPLESAGVYVSFGEVEETFWRWTFWKKIRINEKSLNQAIESGRLAFKLVPDPDYPDKFYIRIDSEAPQQSR
jgi:hypothetical protein